MTKCALAFVLVGAFASVRGEERQWLIFNEDDSNFFRPATEVSVAALERYIDRISEGGQVTHFFMCPNAQLADFDSKVFEPVWTADASGSGYGSKQKAFFEQGIDPYAIWIRRCRERGVSPWMSMRMNDVHFAFDESYRGHSKYWKEHRELWRDPSAETGDWTLRAFNYSKDEVRARSLAFIAELLERYDVDGIECDWMRMQNHLTPGRERVESHFLTEFMCEVRKLATDAGKKRGHAVKVGARVESDPEAAVLRGTDPFAWAKAGAVDLIVPCNYFASADFSLPYRAWVRRMMPINDKVKIVPGTDSAVYETASKKRRLMSIDEYCGWANRLYEEGAPGVYLFNLFQHPSDGEVWNFILDKGLSPEVVRNHTQTVPAGILRECNGILRRRRPLAGVIRWDCWAGKDGIRGGEQTRVLEKTLAPEKYRWRLPWFAEVKEDGSVVLDGARPGVMEREIDYAADAGLDYFIFLNYGINSHKTDALDRFRSAKNANRMQYAICFMFYKVDIPDEIWPQTVAKYIACLEDGNYVRVCGNRPLVYTMHIGGEELNSRVCELKSAAASRGLDPYFVYLNNTPDEMWPKMKELGYDAYGMYATAKGLASGPCAYGDFATNMEERVQGVALRKGHPCVPCCQTGWQKDPRKDYVPYWEKGLAYHSQPGFPAVATPDEIADSIRRVRDFVRTHPEICPANTFTVYAWNEHDEGGWLCPTWTPTGEPDTSRVDALRRANCALENENVFLK